MKVMILSDLHIIPKNPIGIGKFQKKTLMSLKKQSVALATNAYGLYCSRQTSCINNSVCLLLQADVMPPPRRVSSFFLFWADVENFILHCRIFIVYLSYNYKKTQPNESLRCFNGIRKFIQKFK